MDAAAAAVREELADGPLRMSELIARLAPRGFSSDAAKWAAKWAGLWIDLVRVPPSGTWEQRRADLCGLAEQWLPRSREPSETEGLALLVRRYLGAFGPARPASIADWAGVPMALLKPAIEDVAPRRFLDEDDRELVDIDDAPLPEDDVNAPVRFLPTWDATLLVHARKAQILPEQYRPLVFSTKNPQSVGTFLVDGQVAGTWRQDGGRVTVTPFDELPRAAARAVDDEAERLAAFVK